MLLAKTPLRISLFGGGTDFPDWYKDRKGLVISTTIDKYCYVLLRTLPPYFHFKYRLRYYQMELSKNINQIKHPVIRNILKKYYKQKIGIELNHFADIPGLSGLGSSSSFTVTMINLIHKFNGKTLTKYEIAKLAIEFEQKILKESVGSQDQVATTYGGFNCIDFYREKFDVKKVNFSPVKLKKFENNCLLVYTGLSRFAKVLEKKKIKSINKKFNYYKDIFDIANYAKKKLLSNPDKFVSEIPELLNETWKLKKMLNRNVSNAHIENLYEHGLKNGAQGGKLLGSGAGGFFLFVCSNSENKKKLAKSLKKSILVNFKTEEKGTRIIFKNKDYYDVIDNINKI